MARRRRRSAAPRGPGGPLAPRGPGGGPRYFAALMLPGELAGPLAAAAAEVLGLPRHGLRGVEAADLHLTLAFAGPLREAAARELDRALALALLEAPRPSLALGRAGAFPAPGRERVLLAHVQDHSAGRLEELRARVLEAGELAGIPFVGEARRPFRPHVTLARARGSRAPRVPAGFYGLDFGIEWQPAEVAWVRSPGGGAGYEVLAAYTLGNQGF